MLLLSHFHRGWSCFLPISVIWSFLEAIGGAINWLTLFTIQPNNRPYKTFAVASRTSVNEFYKNCQKQKQLVILTLGQRLLHLGKQTVDCSNLVSNKLMGVRFAPSRDKEADISNVSPSPFPLTKGQRSNRQLRNLAGKRRRRANARIVSFVIQSESDDEGLTLESSASLSLHGGNLTLITEL